MATEFKPFEGDTSIFAPHERDGFRNLRDREGRVQPLFRVARKDEAEEDNRDPFKAHSRRLENRRIPQTASPIVDFLVELHRTLYFPEFPSRQHSRFANLGGWQSFNPESGKCVFLILPHESARVSVSGVMDFRVRLMWN
ncbi:MAG: hypothetical protein A3F84_07120 [Candidatus Handelsmanbacteria bacterium RIFCSPLOWO2_12_FULL_64_10]|uniref:Uncharacterized protein n=1 Tax=Handelsmanbacteria sp. (strain RIFCSPLOWO2_12_FULL_64_10) TaxID=1817868 RepID=A0A1F6C5S3_HANXR|nr:MAG: hypothetical protein A3F84_07120 [Candidatus Handelsmanbacteria bacterium RIFCSPLOWO2_12_FULL_64_10]